MPPKVSYRLTQCGEGLLDVMDHLTGWIAKELDGIEVAKRRYDEECVASRGGSPGADIPTG